MPASWAVAIARLDPRVSNNAEFSSQSDRVATLFELRYREQFGIGLKAAASQIVHEIRYRPINASLEYRDQSEVVMAWPIKTTNLLGGQSPIAPLADLLLRALGDLPPMTGFARASLQSFASGNSPPKSASFELDRGPATPFADAAVQKTIGRVGDSGDRNKSRQTEESAAKAPPLRWYGAGATISAKSFVLRDPMVYLSERTPFEDEASCIDLSLEVGYLNWISNGRAGASKIAAMRFCSSTDWNGVYSSNRKIKSQSWRKSFGSSTRTRLSHYSTHTQSLPGLRIGSNRDRVHN